MAPCRLGVEALQLSLGGCGVSFMFDIRVFGSSLATGFGSHKCVCDSSRGLNNFQ